jgi:predicted permease
MGLKFQALIQWCRRLVFRDGRSDRNVHLDRELRDHLFLETHEGVSRGLSNSEAEAAARRAFGNLALTKERVRETWGWGGHARLVQDVRIACRCFGRSPALTLAIVLTLGIGIGANAAMFSVIRTVLLSPLAYADPDRLVYLDIARDEAGPGRFSMIRFEQLRSEAQSFVDVGAFLGNTEDITLSGDGAPEALIAARVTANFLDVLGVDPVVGRGFRAEEDVADSPPSAIISARLWRRRFGEDPGVSGRSVNLDQTPYTVVGVLPDGFAFPFPDVDVWTTRPAEPSSITGSGRSLTLLWGFGRLKPEVGMDQARAELAVLDRRYSDSNPGAAEARYGTGPMRITGLQEQVTQRVHAILWTLFGAVCAVLLIASANVAGLLMARGVSRIREFALRRALGAGHGRLVRQLLTESLVLAAGGGLISLGLCALILAAMSEMMSGVLPRAGEIEMSPVVFVFAAAVSVVVGTLFGLFPALELFGRDSGLLPSGRAVVDAGGKARRGRSRHLLIVGQVALSMVLLVSAGLLIRSLGKIAAVDSGFETSGLLTARIPLAATRYDTPEKRAGFFNAVGETVSALPGVEMATLARSLPTTANTFNTNMGVAGEPAPGPGDPGWSVQIQTVRPGYFETLGIALLRGRILSEQDNARSAAPVALVNETLVQSFWPAWPDSPDPIGRQIGIPIVLRATGARNFEIVGIVSDVRERGIMNDAVATVYLPDVWYPPQTAYVALRADRDPTFLIEDLQRAVQSVDPEQPVTDIRTMDAVVAESLGRERLAGWLLGAFAGIALILALVGLYGVLAYSVAQRREEIGIRRAVGAQRRDILNMVLARGLRLTIAGIAAGLAASALVTRALEGFLFQTNPTDPTTFAVVTLLYLFVASAASTVPALRASRIDPKDILRVG